MHDCFTQILCFIYWPLIRGDNNCGECRHGKCFKTRIFGKVHVFVPSTEGARRVFANDFVNFNKGYVKSMADAVGEKSLLCVSHESHKRIRRLLSDPFSMNSLPKFVKEFDNMLRERLKNFEAGKSLVVLDFSMKVDIQFFDHLN